MRNRFVLALTIGMFSTFFAMVPTLSFANGITVGAGVTMTLNNVSLDLHCQDITIKNGGVLNMASGKIRHTGHLYTESGGTFIWGDGGIYFCGASIPGIIMPLLSH
ncbi:MAG: hypothetical protein JRJ12_01105 [Deltaproteobacteria bacterium]|nr:hypothetical protein [Deltaproteobacteria bacterium]MBW2070067.1 hypothetical protein [Deltaproteobacteria bacterium]